MESGKDVDRKVKIAVKDVKEILSLAYQTTITKIIIVLTVAGGFPGIVYLLKDVLNFTSPISDSIIIYVYICTAIALYTVLRALYSIKRKFSMVSEESDTKKYETLHYLAELDAKHYGLQRKVYTISSFIKSDGSCLSKHSTKLIAYGDRIDKIEHRQTAYSAPPSTDFITIDAEEKISDDIKIIPNIKKQTNNTCYWELSFIPALQKGKELKYSYDVNLLPGTFAMDLQSLTARKLYSEFASTQISYPTEHFQRKVIFPKNYIPTNLGYDVWLGDAHVRHTKEYIRVEQEHYFRTGLDGDDCLYIELHINHPIHGLKYALTWLPPSTS